MKQTITILKLGGSIVTEKSSDKPMFNKKIVERISKELKESDTTKDSKLILVHGAGSYGHPIVKRTNIHKGITAKDGKKRQNQLMAFAETQRLMNILNTKVCEELIKNQLPAFPFQASSNYIMKDKTTDSFNIKPIQNLIEADMIPVLYGVPAYDINQTCSILSGDEIIRTIVKKLKTKFDIKIIFATDVDGLYDKDPNKNTDAKHFQEIHNTNDLDLTGSTNQDVTDGMKGKVQKILDYKVPTRIISGLIPNNLVKALNDESVGTLIRPNN